MANLHRIQPEKIKLNMCFSAPVFFDDGRSMFLAPGKLVKRYHVECLKRWSIPFLMTAGHEIDITEADKLKNSNEDPVELEEFL